MFTSDAIMSLALLLTLTPCRSALNVTWKNINKKQDPGKKLVGHLRINFGRLTIQNKFLKHMTFFLKLEI